MHEIASKFLSMRQKFSSFDEMKRKINSWALIHLYFRSTVCALTRGGFIMKKYAFTKGSQTIWVLKSTLSYAHFVSIVLQRTRQADLFHTDQEVRNWREDFFLCVFSEFLHRPETLLSITFFSCVLNPSDIFRRPKGFWCQKKTLKKVILLGKSEKEKRGRDRESNSVTGCYATGSYVDDAVIGWSSSSSWLLLVSGSMV